MTADTSFSVLTGNNIETRRVKAGGVIFLEGEQADELFVIERVRAHSNRQQNNRRSNG